MRFFAIAILSIVLGSCVTYVNDDGEQEVGFSPERTVRKHAVYVGVNEVQPLMRSPRPIRGIEIIQSPSDIQVPQRFQLKFAEELTEELEHNGFTVGQGDIRVYYKVITYDKRSRALRFLVGPFPAVASSTTVEAIFLASNGARIGHLRAVGVADGALHNGATSLAFERAADRIADRIVDTYCPAPRGPVARGAVPARVDCGRN